MTPFLKAYKTQIQIKIIIIFLNLKFLLKQVQFCTAAGKLFNLKIFLMQSSWMDGRMDGELFVLKFPNGLL